MRFGELLEKLEAGDTTHYLTTQEGSGEDELLTAPLTAVASNLPLRPSLLPTLVPQTINLWLGRTDRLTSSGLHHDYHDNLYCLLKGTKRFRLFSPADAPHMYTHGTIARIHPNGRINYDDDELTVPDGRTVGEVRREALKKAKRAQRTAEASLARAEDAADAATASGPPPNFCRVSSLADASVLQRYPRLRHATMVECEIHSNEMLFLPAGWFHEVSSLGEHCALNYWFHPPDTKEYDRPYRAQMFWKREWKRMTALLARRSVPDAMAAGGGAEHAGGASDDEAAGAAIDDALDAMLDAKAAAAGNIVDDYDDECIDDESEDDED